MLEILSQAFGIFSLVCTILSLQQKTKKKMLTLQILNNFFFVLHYSCLFALSGAWISLVALIRCYVFYKYDEKKIPKSVFALMIFIIFNIIFGIFSYDGLLSLIPVLASSIYTYAVWQDDLKVFRKLAIFDSILWVIYNNFLRTPIGVLTSIFELSSGVIALIRFDIKKKKK